MTDSKGYGCYIDDCDGDLCVFDSTDEWEVVDCTIAVKLQNQGKGKLDCKHWKMDELNTVKALLKEAHWQLEYCNYGDSWENADTKKLRDSLNDYFKENK